MENKATFSGSELSAALLGLSTVVIFLLVWFTSF